MIENREQRKKSSLLRRRKIGILVALLIVVVLGVALAIVYNYVNTVTPYYDVDDIEYHLKQENGIYRMYDKEGNLLPQDNEFGYYRTKAGTLLLLDPLTGEIKERVIPDFYDPTLSETVDHQKILIFPNIEGEDVLSIKIYNSYEKDGFYVWRYNVSENKLDSESDFVLGYKDNPYSSYLTLNKELVVSLYVSAGYALATGKIDPAEVEKLGFSEYGLVAGERTRTGWFYRVTINLNGTDHFFNVDVATGKILGEEIFNDSIEATYDMAIPKTGVSPAKAIMLATNTLSPSTSDKVKSNIVLRAYEETYTHEPAYYIIGSSDGQRHKMIIGDRLVDGSGYYAQYENVDTGEKRNTVYTLPATIADTLLAPAKAIVTPQIAYPTTATNYFDVAGFTVSKKQDDKIGNYNDIISFTYLDIEDRTGTVEGIHPYKFTDGAFAGYRPNYDNIDVTLSSLMQPTINEISVLSPTDADKIAYGIAKPKTDENGNIVYDKDGNVYAIYDSKYKVSFYRTATDEDGREYDFLQTMYISDKNTDGNFYVYTTLDTDKTKFSFDMICEVSAATLNFLTWDQYSWVYPDYLQIGILYVEECTVTRPNYSINFKLDHTEVNKISTLTVSTTDSTGRNFDTFGYLDFKDRHGNRWIITPSEITVYDSAGNEIKPTSRHYEHNSIGEQVRVINEQITAEDGRRITVTKDYIEIVHINGEKEQLLRYHNSIFKKFFALLTGVSIVDSHNMTEEEEKALTPESDKFVASVRIKDNVGGELYVEYYTLTARKMYIKVNGSGGFYVSTSHVNESLEAIDKFLNKTDVELDH